MTQSIRNNGDLNYECWEQTNILRVQVESVTADAVLSSKSDYVMTPVNHEKEKKQKTEQAKKRVDKVHRSHVERCSCWLVTAVITISVHRLEKNSGDNNTASSMNV